MRASLAAAGLAALAAATLALADTFVDVPTNGLEPGWQFRAYQYTNKDISASIASTERTGVVSNPDFDAGGGSPPAVYGQGTASDRIVIVWSGFLRVTLAGTYQFKLGSDDGSMLYIDGLVVSRRPCARSPGASVPRSRQRSVRDLLCSC